MNAKNFVAALAEIRLPNVFNPYADRCVTHDLTGAPSVRRRNLVSYLESVTDIEVDSMWMGRDLGYRGGRRTGLAFTDESHLLEFATRYPGSAPKRATRGPAVAERTATEIWGAICALPNPPLLWNVFPFHPHEPADEMTNRRFTACELKLVDILNRELVSWLGIRRIICIGQDAAKYASSLGVEVECIRHPSYGGINDFRIGIERLYGPVLSRPSQPELFQPLPLQAKVRSIAAYGTIFASNLVMTLVFAFYPISSTVLEATGVYSNEETNFQVLKDDLQGVLRKAGLSVVTEDKVSTVKGFVRFNFGGVLLLCKAPFEPKNASPEARREAAKNKKPDPALRAGAQCVPTQSNELRKFTMQELPDDIPGLSMLQNVTRG